MNGDTAALNGAVARAKGDGAHRQTAKSRGRLEAGGRGKSLGQGFDFARSPHLVLAHVQLVIALHLSELIDVVGGEAGRAL